MLRTALAGLRHRTARLALSSLTIALGVAFVSRHPGHGRLHEPGLLRQLRGRGQERRTPRSPRRQRPAGIRPGASGAPSLPPSALAPVAGTSGTAAAAGRLLGPAPLLGTDGKVIGNGEPPGSASTSPPTPRCAASLWRPGTHPDSVRAGRRGQGHRDRRALPARPDGARGGPHRPGARVHAWSARSNSGANHAYGNATVAAFTTATAFSVTGRPGYDQIVARADPGISQATLASRLRAQPGLAGDQVQTGSQLATAEANAAVHFTQQFTTVILVFALIALVVACIVIYNTFTILVTQRGRELALLRCIGRDAAARCSAARCWSRCSPGWSPRRPGLWPGWVSAGAWSGCSPAFGAPIPAGPVVLSPDRGAGLDGRRGGRHAGRRAAAGAVRHPGRAGRGAAAARTRPRSRAGSAGCGSAWPWCWPRPGSA